MIAKLSYLITRAIIHVHREVIVGKSLAELETVQDCGDGYSPCGVTFDDHDDVECETEEFLPIWGDDEEG